MKAEQLPLPKSHLGNRYYDYFIGIKIEMATEKT